MSFALLDKTTESITLLELGFSQLVSIAVAFITFFFKVFIPQTVFRVAKLAKSLFSFINTENLFYSQSCVLPYLVISLSFARLEATECDHVVMLQICTPV